MRGSFRDQLLNDFTAAHPLAGNLPLDNISYSVFKDRHVFRIMVHHSIPLEVHAQVTTMPTLLSQSASLSIYDGLSQGLEQTPAGVQAATKDSTRDGR